jgi:minor extracellular serine protease Vpr
MKSYTSKKVVGFPVLLLAAIWLVGAATPSQGQDTSQDGRAPNKALSRLVLPGTQDLQLIIELQSPSTVEYMTAREAGASQGTTAAGLQRRIDYQSTEAAVYRQQLAREQQTMRDRLSTLPRLQIEGSVDMVMNALMVRIPTSVFPELRRLPDIRKIYFSRPRRALLDTAATLENAQALWDRAGGRAQAGKGVKIGILDTGFDMANPMFKDIAFVPPPGFPKGELTLTNRKVIVARNFLSYLSNPQRVQSAIDEVGHGSFVAAVAAGNQVQAPLATISGMAPGAFLGNYKIFGTPGVNDYTTDSAVVAAINAAVADGMDVINMSLGGLDYIPPDEDPESVAIESAVRAGVVVVVAAGNEGPGSHTLDSPGNARDAITVGSVSNARAFYSSLHVTAPAPVPASLTSLAYMNGTGPSIASGIPNTKIVDVAALDGNGLACSSFPAGSINRQIAFIQRGQCTFAVKVANATAAGATAVVVYNNDPSSGLIVMSNLESSRIPSVMISNTDGLSLKQFISSNSGLVQVSLDSSTAPTAVPIPARILSGFSSRGPSSDFGIKPDLVAVGENVYSAAETSTAAGALYSPDGFIMGSGTSFAAPMVAGAAAGLRELFPSLSPLEIKSLLTNTASRNLTADGTNPPDLLQAGSGLLDMAASASAGAVFSPTNLSYGIRPYTGTLSLTQRFTIKNISSSTDQFALSASPLVAGPNIGFSQNNTGPIAPNQSTDISVSLQVSSPQSGGFQGFILVQSVSTGAVYRIPYWAGLYVPDPARIISVSQSPSGSNFSTLDAALAAARPGNVIEIADSSTYPVSSSGITITTNREGLPLHNITLRARAGQSPVIDGTKTSAFSDILIIGLQNVLLQGLTISGGETGVGIYQPSSLFPTSMTIDQSMISNIVTGGTAAAGIDIEGPVSLPPPTPTNLAVSVTKSTVSGSSGTGIVANIGSQLTLFGSTVQKNGSDGIDALEANVDIFQSTVSNNTGPGLNCELCSGTIDGSSFSQNAGSLGDGIEIVDGQFAITNNSFDSNNRAGVGFFADTGNGPSVRFAHNILHANGRYGIRSDAAQNAILDANLIEDNAEGVRLAGASKVLLSNNIVVRSTNSRYGYGVELAGSSTANLVNNTIYRNLAPGIIAGAGTTGSVVNSIISGNGSGDINGMPAGSVQYSLVGDGSVTGFNNITGDPKFNSPDSNDFTPGTGSPAIDAGFNVAPNLPFLDFNGQLRVASAAAILGDGKVDLGAIEARSTFPLIFPLIANGAQAAMGDSFSTGFALLNNGSGPANVQFSAYGASGGLLPGSKNPGSTILGVLSQIPILGYQLVGTAVDTILTGGLLSGSDRPLFGFSLLFDSDYKRFADGVNASSQTGTDLILMRQKNDQGSRADFVLFNPGVNAANVTATLFSSAGSPSDSPKSSIIPPKGQLIFGFTNILSSSGYVRIESDRPISGMELVGNTQQRAALPSVSPGSEARLFFPHFAVNGGFSTLAGIVNGTNSPADLILTAYDNAGQQIGIPASVTLEANQQLLQSVSSLFALADGPVTTGYILARSDQPGIQGFTEFDYDDGIHKSSAVVIADALPKQNLLFSHVANQVPAAAGIYQTGIALLNPFGTPVNYTMRVFDGSGAKVAEKTDVLGPGQKVSKVLSYPLPGAGFFTQPLALANGHIEIQTDYALLGLELFYTEDLSLLASVPTQSR